MRSRYAAGRQNSSKCVTRRLGQNASSCVRITARVLRRRTAGASGDALGSAGRVEFGAPRRAEAVRIRNSW
jgi:hypothetical protein